jgi:hypothetical protein
LGDEDMHDKDRQKMIIAFVTNLMKIQDYKSEMPKIRDLLNDVIILKKLDPPIIEFLTLLRFKKPTLFMTLRDACLPGTTFFQVIRLEIQLDVALERLGITEQHISHSHVLHTS